MRLVIVCCSVSMALALCACSSSGDGRGPAPAADLPLNVGSGAGSEHGNYTAQTDGEMRGPAGEHCVVFNWDRPLTRDLAVRLRSASCESRERPGFMVSRELSRTIVPIAESNLKDVQSGQ